MATVAVLNAALRLNTKDFNAGMARSKLSLLNFKKGINPVIIAITALAAAATLAGTALFKLAKSGALLEDAGSKFDRVFENTTDLAQNFALQMQAAFDLSERAAKNALGAFGDLLIPLGMTEEAALRQAAAWVGLTKDLASFNAGMGATQQSVEKDIIGALSGASERMLKYGSDIKVATLEQFALEKGIISIGEKLTGATKAQVILAKVYQDSQKAVGDYSRTFDSFNNTQERVTARFDDLTSKIGLDLLPVGVEMLNLFIKISNQVDKKGFAEGAITGVKTLMFALEAVSKAVHLGISAWKALKFGLMVVQDVIIGVARAAVFAAQVVTIGMSDTVNELADFIDAQFSRSEDYKRTFQEFADAGGKAVSSFTEIEEGAALIGDSVKHFDALGSSLDQSLVTTKKMVAETKRLAKVERDYQNTLQRRQKMFEADFLALRKAVATPEETRDINLEELRLKLRDNPLVDAETIRRNIDLIESEFQEALRQIELDATVQIEFDTSIWDEAITTFQTMLQSVESLEMAGRSASDVFLDRIRELEDARDNGLSEGAFQNLVDKARDSYTRSLGIDGDGDLKDVNAGLIDLSRNTLSGMRGSKELQEQIKANKILQSIDDKVGSNQGAVAQ